MDCLVTLDQRQDELPTRLQNPVLGQLEQGHRHEPVPAELHNHLFLQCTEYLLAICLELFHEIQGMGHGLLQYQGKCILRPQAGNRASRHPPRN